MAVTCSARGCSAEAVWSLLWNNPRLHTPDRRKSWLACADHRETLGGFLAARGFLRDTVALADLAPGDVGERGERAPERRNT